MTSRINIVSFVVTLNTFLVVLAASFRGHRANPSNPPPVDPSTFYKCIHRQSNTLVSNFYSPKIDQASFKAVLNSTAQNLRCLLPSVPKPLLIFTPSNETHVQAAVSCAAVQNLNIRVRSGGHDYEGLSYVSFTGKPFVVIDLSKFRKVDVDVASRSAWVQAGATIGELYYWISRQSPKLGFPAGLCTSVGIGGHLTGGAYGPMMRKYGLGADNVLDARIVVANGTVLDRKGMGEDLFWAIRGGGGGSFGIILSWRVKLVHVPLNVTVFTVAKSWDEGATKILYKWQKAATRIDWKLFMRIIMRVVVPPTPTGKKTVQTLYQALYLGNKANLLRAMNAGFPDFGLTAPDCVEMSWIESVVYIGGSSSTTKPEDLLLARPTMLTYFKAKSDFVTRALTEEDIKAMREKVTKVDGLTMIWNPYGGRMSKYREDEIPFTHRNVLYKIQYLVNWSDVELETQSKHEAAITKLYDYMTPYVSKNPRQSYVNYRDLDIGKVERDGLNLSCPSLWGPKYFKDNFWRLVRVKGVVDPHNVFSHEQSIPTPWSSSQCVKLV